MKTKQMLLTVAILLIAVLVCGCGPRAAIVKDYYLIETPRPNTPPQVTTEIILSVKPFTIGAGYQSKGLVYYLGDQKFDSDFYHEYFISPSQMITEQTQIWLDDSGLFKQVLPPASMIAPTHLLEGDIRRIYYDVQDKDNLHTVLDITFYLLNKKGRRTADIEFTKSYHATHPFDGKNQQQAVNAMKPCLAEILAEFEKDLARYFKDR